ncbi:MAG: TIGR01777 family oxidoreductase [Phycisphaerales bacterium]|nr:TIGR01777 family oxidoreductase [Phycisphaerales bacterium]
MRIFITGGTGLIGQRVIRDRLERGDQILALTRNEGRARKALQVDNASALTLIEGSVTNSGAWKELVSGCDAVIHLAGANITGRWTKKYKSELFRSRIDSTAAIVDAIESASSRPSVLVSASAIGYYGPTGDAIIDERAPVGKGFLPELTSSWEREATRTDAATRVVLLRIGPVLDRKGGVLGKMLLPFKLGLGGTLGLGRQFMSWIHHKDLVGLFDMALSDSTLYGAINATAPNPATNKYFTQCLAKALHRPALFPMPRIVLRVLMGEVANHVFESQRVFPARAERSGYQFVFPHLKEAVVNAARKLPEEKRVGISVSSPDGSGYPTSSTMPTRPIKLLAIPLNVGLLGEDGTVSKETIAALREAEYAGCLVVAATSRSPQAARWVLESAGLQSVVIACNGAVIWSMKRDEPQYHEPLHGHIAAQILEDVRKEDRGVIACVDVLNRSYADLIDAEMLSPGRLAVLPEHVSSFETIFKSPITRLTVLGAEGRMQHLAEIISERFWKTRMVGMFLDDPTTIQMVHPLADKGIALQRIAGRLGLHRDEVMAIGGHANDQGMMDWAGFSVAMADGIHAVRVLANAEVPSRAHHGVVKAIHDYVLSQR